MKEIPLTQGRVAIVDDADAELAESFRWYFKQGYAVTNISNIFSKRKTVFLHRLIAKTPDGMQTDHINGNKLDNRRANLRICTDLENRYNREKYDNNTSGYKGVRPVDGAYDRWRAVIKVNHKNIHLGCFASREEAARAYDEAAREYFGEFAKLNFV